MQVQHVSLRCPWLLLHLCASGVCAVPTLPQAGLHVCFTWPHHALDTAPLDAASRVG